eukprot:COSAG04_NODE_13539_length_601_cov_54.151394_1_plen_163_part_10
MQLGDLPLPLEPVAKQLLAAALQDDDGNVTQDQLDKKIAGHGGHLATWMLTTLSDQGHERHFQPLVADSDDDNGTSAVSAANREYSPRSAAGHTVISAELGNTLHMAAAQASQVADCLTPTSKQIQRITRGDEFLLVLAELAPQILDNKVCEMLSKAITALVL